MRPGIHSIGTSLIVLAMTLIVSSTASAQLAGWEATVVAEDRAGNSYISNVYGPTWPACDSQRVTAVNNFVALGLTVTSAGSCAPIILRMPRIPEVLWPPKPLPWPFPGPVCLSCPILNEKTIREIYPKDVERVQELMDKFRVEKYNRALMELQQEFDLEQFESELFKLEQERLRGANY